MNALWRIAPWFSRLLLLVVAALFVLIGTKYLLNPVANAAADEITLGSVMAISRLRIGLGAFPLSLAALFLLCLLAPGRVMSGLVALFVCTAVISAVRFLGIIVDGPAQEASRLLHVEVTLAALSAVGILLEFAARWRDVSRSAAANPAQREVS